MSPDTITVIVTSADYGFFLPTCLDSVLLQTRLPDQLIFLDDGSVDHSVDIWRRYKPLFRSRISSANQKCSISEITGEWRGRVDSLNVAMACVTSDLVLIVDADDILHSSFLEVCSEAIASYDVVYTDACLFGMTWESRQAPDFSRDIIKSGNYIPMTSLFRKAAFDKTEGFREFQQEDHDLWLQIAESGGTFLHVPQYLLNWRQHPYGQRHKTGDAGRRQRLQSNPR